MRKCWAIWCGPLLGSPAGRCLPCSVIDRRLVVHRDISISMQEAEVKEGRLRLERGPAGASLIKSE